MYRASFVIYYHTRRIDNLLQTLRFLTRWHQPVIEQSELILVCHDRCGPVESEFGRTRNFNLELPEMMLPRQCNFGIRQAESENIILLESDRLLPPGYFDAVLTDLKPKQVITTLRMIRPHRPYSDDDLIADQFERYDEWRSATNETLCRNLFSGNATFKAQDYWEAGGMDEAYVGYGWADHDTTNAMTKIGCQPVFRNEMEIHLWHEPMTYGSVDQKQLFINNGLRYCRKWNVDIPTLLRNEMKQYRRMI